jgi:biotin carboxyl carrier protein
MRFKRAEGGKIFEVEISACDGKTLRASIDGEEITGEIETTADGGAILRFDGRRIRVNGARARKSILVAAGPASFEFAPVEGRFGVAHHGLAAVEIAAPMPGKVLRVMVAEGDVVASGQGLIVLEAMKMETTIAAESDATVKKIRVSAGDAVEHGQVLIEFSPAPADPSTGESQAQAR